MPKLKTKKGVAKRFSKTKKGKIGFKSSNKGHLLSHKSAERIRRLRKKRMVTLKKQTAYLKQMLPYG